MISYILYGFAILCLFAGIQARKDFIRFVGCVGLAMIFGFVGLLASGLEKQSIGERVDEARAAAAQQIDADDSN